jgi:signal transduction histidine kinase
MDVPRSSPLTLPASTDEAGAWQASWMQAPCAMYRVDAAGRLLVTNLRWQAMHALPPAEALGLGWLTTVLPEDTVAVQAAWSAMVSRGLPIDLRYRLRQLQGLPLTVHNRAVPLHSADGRLLGWSGSLEDVTEPLKSAHLLHQEQGLRMQLERHARDLNTVLRERNEMINVLAHEVRQPLNNASAALQNAAHTLGAKDTPELAESLVRAQRVLVQVMAGVDNALAVASLVAGHGQVVLAESDVDLLLGIAIADMPSPDRERIRVIRDTTTRTLMLDPSLTRLALRNLLANALAFSPAHAPVDLRLSDAPNGLFIDVIDRGSGIDAAVLPKLFERGARGRVHERRGSHGLGLYIVRRALEMQGGRAFLVATGPTGSWFRMEINEDGLSTSTP